MKVMPCGHRRIEDRQRGYDTDEGDGTNYRREVRGRTIVYSVGIRKGRPSREMGRGTYVHTQIFTHGKSENFTLTH